MSSVDKDITLLEITFSGRCHQWTKALIMLYLCPLKKHPAGNVICGQRYNISRDNIRRAMSSVDKVLTFLEITLSGQCHYWTRYNLIGDNIQRQCFQWTKV